MLLRSKGTGVRGELFYREGEERPLKVRVVSENGGAVFVYKTLGELLKDWEDFIVHVPKEPLIEDKKARKIFREWADLFGAESFRVSHWTSPRKTTSIESTDLIAEPIIELPGHIGKDSEIYTKVELCGEEERNVKEEE